MAKYLIASILCHGDPMSQLTLKLPEMLYQQRIFRALYKCPGICYCPEGMALPQAAGCGETISTGVSLHGDCFSPQTRIAMTELALLSSPRNISQ